MSEIINIIVKAAEMKNNWALPKHKSYIAMYASFLCVTYSQLARGGQEGFRHHLSVHT